LSIRTVRINALTRGLVKHVAVAGRFNLNDAEILQPLGTVLIAEDAQEVGGDRCVVADGAWRKSTDQSEVSSIRVN
jgi:hypothetical protein